KDQASVVGSTVVGFIKGVTKIHRTDLVNSAMLAQLAATRSVADPNDLEAWYQRYFEVLTNIGWVIQDRQFNTFQQDGHELDVHQAVLKIASGIMGPKAVDLVKDTLEQLKHGPGQRLWARIFSQ